MLAKNQTARGFARNAPHILGYELLALGHALLRERTLLPRLRGRRAPARGSTFAQKGSPASINPVRYLLDARGGKASLTVEGRSRTRP